MSERAGLLGMRGAVLAGASVIVVVAGVAWFSGRFTPETARAPAGEGAETAGDAAVTATPPLQSQDAVQQSSDKAEGTVAVKPAAVPQEQDALAEESDLAQSEDDNSVAQAEISSDPVEPATDKAVPEDGEADAGQVAREPSESVAEETTEVEVPVVEIPVQAVETQVVETPVRPRFDLVRVEPDGSATIAGRGAPDAEIVTELDGQEISRVTAASDGSFVQFLSLPVSQVPQMIRLWVALPEGGRLYALEDAILAPVEEPEMIADADPQDVLPPVPAETAVATQESEVAPLEGEEDKITARADEDGQTDQPAPAGLAIVREEPAQADTQMAETKENATAASAPSVDQDTEVARVAQTQKAASAPPAVESPALAENEQLPSAKPERVPSAPSEPLSDEESLRVVQQVDVLPEVSSPSTAVTAPSPIEDMQVATGKPERARAPTVLLAGEEGLRVVQQVNAPPEVMSAVAIDTISYSEDGEVQLSGRASGKGYVRVYVDNKAVVTSQIAADGGWKSDLPNVDTGIYTLRVDEINDAGEVTSRVETPFQREEQAVVAKAGQVSAVTVQPGNTLWAIARENYGEGILYVRLFQANKDRIRNPDLIYPGQVFDIPHE